MAASIVGKWNKRAEIMGEVQLNMTWEFRGDGTYSYINAVTGMRTDGEYEISGDKILFPRIKRIQKFELEGNTLWLDYGSNGKLDFERK